MAKSVEGGKERRWKVVDGERTNYSSLKFGGKTIREAGAIPGEVRKFGLRVFQALAVFQVFQEVSGVMGLSVFKDESCQTVGHYWYRPSEIEGVALGVRN